jgi:hypothetical protein
MSIAPIENYVMSATFDVSGDPKDVLERAANAIRTVAYSAEVQQGRILIAVSAVNEQGESILSRAGYKGVGAWSKDVLGFSNGHTTNLMNAARAALIIGDDSISTRYAKALTPVRGVKDEAIIRTVWEDAKTEAIADAVKAEAAKIATERGAKRPAKQDLVAATEVVDTDSIKPKAERVRALAEQAAEQAGVSTKGKPGRKAQTSEERFVAAFERVVKQGVADGLLVADMQGYVEQVFAGYLLAQEATEDAAAEAAAAAEEVDAA